MNFQERHPSSEHLMIVEREHPIIPVIQFWNFPDTKLFGGTPIDDTGKKSRFLRFLKVAGTIFMTTVSKKNGKKKVATTMVDFNNKVLNV